MVSEEHEDLKERARVKLERARAKSAVQNPKALGQKERELWMKIEPILSELLEEVKEKGKHEISFIPIKEIHLKNVMDNLIEINKNRNRLDSLLESKERLAQFLAGASKFGFNEFALVNLRVRLEAYICVLSTECFKLLLLYHLREVNPRVSNFPTTMNRVAPNSWKKLRQYVDNDFRNTLAHGIWTMEWRVKNEISVPFVVLFKDAELVPYKTLNLFDFMVEVKKQNILCSCLKNLIMKRRKAKFFT
jgi:hypothetical protein